MPSSSGSSSLTHVFGWLDPEDEGSVLFHNSRNYKPSGTTCHHIPEDSSIHLLRGVCGI